MELRSWSSYSIFILRIFIPSPALGKTVLAGGNCKWLQVIKKSFEIKKGGRHNVTAPFALDYKRNYIGTTFTAFGPFESFSTSNSTV